MSRYCSNTSVALGWLIAAIVNTGASQASEWQPPSICNAAVYTYFFLDTPPELTGTNGNSFEFQSETGRHYTCSTSSNGEISLTWKNDNGKSMSSKVSRFSVNGENLTIKTNILTKNFDITSSPWKEKSSKITPTSDHVTPDAVDEKKARKWCEEAIIEKANLPSTVDMHSFLGYRTEVSPDGNRETYQDFSAKNAFGVKLNFQARCLMSPDGNAEIHITEKP